MTQLQAIAPHLADTPPDGLLFHYTNPTGLVGIITSKHLWATHIKHLNDSMEFKYAIELARRCLDAMIGREVDAARRQGLAQLRLGVDRAGINICVTSFTEDGDNLGQWRGYGKSGYSLGFGYNTLKQLADARQWLLGRCVYRRHEQEALMEAILEEILGKFMSVPDEETAELRDLHPGDPVALYLNQYAAFFKDPAFSAEREWRLVSRPTSYKNMKFRPAAARLVPYAEFGLIAGDDQPLELRSLTVGPTADPELAKEAAEGLLVGNRLRNFAINLSAVPFRDW